MTLGKGFYRFLGIVAAIAAIVQSAIWIILSLFGIICYYADCGALPRSTAFGRAFNLVYLNTEGTVNSPCIDPIFFHVIMWLYLFLSIVWALLSAYLLFCTLKNSKKHKFSGPIWITFTLFLCVIDCVFFVIFTVDFHRSLETNFHMEYVASPMERSNFDCVFRRMYDFDNPKGEYTAEERAMIKLSIANEKAKLSEKLSLLERLSSTLNTFFIANKRNPLLLPPKFTTPAAPSVASTAPPTPAVVANSDDFDHDPASDLFDRDFDEITLIHDPTVHENIDSSLQQCNRRFRRYRTRIGARMMIAPSATMMTIAIRGYILWLFNVCMAMALWHFYVYKQRESILSLTFDILVYAMRKSLNNIEIPKIKGKDSLYRYVGIVGATLTFFQSILWSILCLIAVIFFAVGGSVDSSGQNSYLALYSVNMAQMYFSSKSQSDSFLSPVIVCVLFCLYFVASVNLIVASAYIFKVFRKWNKTKSIIKATQYWCISAIVMFAIEFVTFVLFFIDYLKLSKNGGILGAGPATLMTLASKGWLMSFFNFALAVVLIFLHYCIKSRPL